MAKETQLVNSGSFLEKRFHLKENHTNVRTEIIAGLTTFLTCTYILAVNPAILSLNRNGFQGGTMGDGYLGSYRLHRNGPFD